MRFTAAASRATDRLPRGTAHARACRRQYVHIGRTRSLTGLIGPPTRDRRRTSRAEPNSTPSQTMWCRTQPCSGAGGWYARTARARRPCSSRPRHQQPVKPAWPSSLFAAIASTSGKAEHRHGARAGSARQGSWGRGVWWAPSSRTRMPAPALCACGRRVRGTAAPPGWRCSATGAGTVRQGGGGVATSDRGRRVAARRLCPARPPDAVTGAAAFTNGMYLTVYVCVLREDAHQTLGAVGGWAPSLRACTPRAARERRRWPRRTDASTVRTSHGYNN